MIKTKKYDWKDSNVEKLGSDLDRGVKKESAETEPAWKKAHACTTPNLFIWRIEKFKVKEWPKEMYGKFYSGDSYIILNIYKEAGGDQLLYDVHFWIGAHSTQDEYGTAAYKTVELDTLLDDRPVQHREVEGHESTLFKSYFPSITYMKGGCPSGFKHVETKEVTALHLFHFAGEKRNIVIKEVKASSRNLDSGDVFILDLGNIAYQWNGSGSSKDERFKAAQYLRELSNDRFGKTKTEVLEESDTGPSHEFFANLSNEETKKSFKQAKESYKHEKQLFKLSDESGNLEFSCLGKGDFNKEDITEDDVFIIDNGETIYVYVGECASETERKKAFYYAHNYLKETTYPFLPITVVNKKIAGINQENFQKTLSA